MSAYHHICRLRIAQEFQAWHWWNSSVIFSALPSHSHSNRGHPAEMVWWGRKFLKVWLVTMKGQGEYLSSSGAMICCRDGSVYLELLTVNLIWIFFVFGFNIPYQTSVFRVGDNIYCSLALDLVYKQYVAVWEQRHGEWQCELVCLLTGEGGGQTSGTRFIASEMTG